MAFWFYRGLRKGIATTGYPKTVDAWAGALPSPPAFHSARLTVELVDRLVAGCPGGALSREQRALFVDIGRCTGCGRCVELGGGAVAPSGEFELAATGRAALVKQVPIGGRAEEHVAGF
jgi:dissimilatory sulfite reductase (desulfoviridin) alpha/beta subunit